MVAGGTLERITLADRERYGVRDYTNIFRKARTPSSQKPFSKIILQDKAIDTFVSALTQNRRGILNYGPPGVGKSMTIDEYVRLVRAVENGELSHCKYSRRIKKHIDKIVATTPRGDWVSFWNPVNAKDVYCFRVSEPASEYLSTVRKNVTHWHENLVTKLNDVLDANPDFEGGEDPQKVRQAIMNCNQQFYKVIKKHNNTFTQFAEKETDVFLKKWYSEVTEKICEESQITQIVDTLMSRIDSRDDQINTIKPHHITVNVQEGVVMLKELLEPEFIEPDSDKERLVIKRINTFSATELLPHIDTTSRTKPYHKAISLGALATAQVVIVEDDANKLFKDEKIHGPLLTFLQNGQLSFNSGSAQLEVYNPSWLIVNDSEYPFEVQRYEGLETSIDYAMADRFSQIDWPSTTLFSEKDIPKFKKFFVDVAREYDENMKISAEGMNFLFHKVYSTTHYETIPLNMRSIKHGIEKMLAQVEAKGKKILSKEDVQEFLFSQRNSVKQYQATAKSVDFFHNPTFEKRVGEIFTLGVGSDGTGCVSTDTVAVHHNWGELSSLEVDSEMVDPTYMKGVRKAHSYISSKYGPIEIETDISFGEFDFSGGPSSSAAITYILMSAYGNIPINRRTYVTGTINDAHGNIGPIGDVYGKTRGVFEFAHMLSKKGLESFPCNVLIPPSNVEELLRDVQFDKELSERIENGDVQIYAHKIIDEGFSFLSELEPENNDALIKHNIENIRQQIMRQDAEYNAMARGEENDVQGEWVKRGDTLYLWEEGYTKPDENGMTYLIPET